VVPAVVPAVRELVPVAVAVVAASVVPELVPVVAVAASVVPELVPVVAVAPLAVPAVAVRRVRSAALVDRFAVDARASAPSAKSLTRCRRRPSAASVSARATASRFGWLVAHR
jgi:hypothetical protein